MFSLATQQFLFFISGIAHVAKLLRQTNFAGYGKMPEYEHIFINFLLSLGQNKCKKKDDT